MVQKALTDDDALAKRTSAVILFGTPSGGLVKARSIFFWKRQLADMAKSGPFVTELRTKWQKRFASNAPFTFLAVAGERDQFVPPESSIKPFPDDQQAVVSGNHTSMLAPGHNDTEALALIAGRIAAGNPGSALGDPLARSIERGDFRKVVADLYPGREQLDRKALVRLAIALDALGKRDEAYEMLAKRADLDSDAIGTMAGRLKRKWLLSRQQADGDAAMEHYAKGHALATAANNLPQVYSTASISRSSNSSFTVTSRPRRSARKRFSRFAQRATPTAVRMRGFCQRSARPISCSVTKPRRSRPICPSSPPARMIRGCRARPT